MYGIKNEIDNLVIGEGEGAIERRQKKLMRIKREVILLGFFFSFFGVMY